MLSTALEPVAVNPAAESLFGVSQTNPALMKDLMRRNSWVEKMVGECLANGQDLSQAETTLALRRGTISVSASVSPLLTRSGQLVGAIVLLHDLSHQRGFRSRVVGDEASANLGLSPAGLAHEIKNPLTGIKGAADSWPACFRRIIAPGSTATLSSAEWIGWRHWSRRCLRSADRSGSSGSQSISIRFCIRRSRWLAFIRELNGVSR